MGVPDNPKPSQSDRKDILSAYVTIVVICLVLLHSIQPSFAMPLDTIHGQQVAHCYVTNIGTIF